MIDAIQSFAQSSAGLILGIVLVFVGITGFITFQLFLIPRLRKEKGRERDVSLFNSVSWIDMILFTGMGCILIAWHVRGS